MPYCVSDRNHQARIEARQMLIDTINCPPELAARVVKGMPGYAAKALVIHLRNHEQVFKGLLAACEAAAQMGMCYNDGPLSDNLDDNDDREIEISDRVCSSVGLEQTAHNR